MSSSHNVPRLPLFFSKMRICHYYKHHEGVHRINTNANHRQGKGYILRSGNSAPFPSSVLFLLFNVGLATFESTSHRLSLGSGVIVQNVTIALSRDFGNCHAAGAPFPARAFGCVRLPFNHRH